MPLVKKPDPTAIKSGIKAAGMVGVRKTLQGVQKRHEDVVKPWKSKDRPKFIPVVKRQHNAIFGFVNMEGENAEQAHKTVWQLLEHGTKVRFMQLSGNWQSKTSPRQLSSGPGAGFKLGIDTKDGQPGIVAREWSDTVGKAEKPNADRNIREAWANGFQIMIGR